ncbi:MAG: hypothetical protein JOZ90_15580 [Alphaproteobacteria bacterium]|nr:hypothetical protein [Alphaproteobacteria bacterium]MBV9371719.1 hypothetical protein [Alphaproteobacteria bacterium]MBV9902495.1 hypothetical protein [Alphaproteobacteria bacterium]
MYQQVPGYYAPYSQGGDAGTLSPQGFFGNLLGSVAPIAGTVAGGMFGAPMVGGALGGLAGRAARMLPFEAAPQLPPELAPQGFFGNLLSQVAPIAGGAIGQMAGHPQLGQQIGNVAGHFSRFLPFEAAPQLPPELAPQGFFGNLLSQVAPIAGGAIGQIAGHPQLGQQIGSVAGHLGRFLPFDAAPQLPPELAPQGFFGNLLSQVAPIAGGAIGQIAGHPQLGQQIGSVAGQLGRFLPFEAAPQLPPELAPQGFFGNLLGQVAPIAGSAIGQLAGHPQLGQQIGSVAGQLGRFLPFQAAPQLPPELAPQGFFGNLLSQVAPIAGGAIGQMAGHPQMGQQIGSAAGHFARFLPFQAAPQLPPELAPQGFFGNLLGSVAPIAGGMIGGLAGNRQLGQQIGGLAGQLGRQFIPFSAAPQIWAYPGM